MASQDVYPKRKRLHRAVATQARELSRLAPSNPPAASADREALDVAGYVHDMTAQLEAMALAAGLDLLGYFLGMARSEADLFVRTNVEDSSRRVEADAVGSEESQAEFHSGDE